LDDTLNLGRAEIVDQLVFLDVTKYLINENDPLPFIPGFSGLNFIRPFVDNQFETFELFKVKIYFIIQKSLFARNRTNLREFGRIYHLVAVL
jgi:hypothetical protein